MPALELEQAPGIFQDESISLTGSSLFGSTNSLDLFKAPVKPKISFVALSIDLFHLPAPSSSLSIDLFQPPVPCSDSSVTVGECPKLFSPTSSELFADFPQQQSTANLAKQVPDSFHESEGWATFDTPQPSASVPGTENITPENIASNGGGSIGKFDLFSPSNTSMQWPSFQYSSIHGPSSDISSPWSDSLHNVTAPNTTSTQVSLIMIRTAPSSDSYMGFRRMVFSAWSVSCFLFFFFWWIMMVLCVLNTPLGAFYALLY